MSAKTGLRTKVLIVGAGPSGLMAAMTLARLGVDAIVVDGKSGPTRESRALGVQARSLEIYDQLGLLAPILAARTAAEGASIGFRDRVLGTIPLRRFGGGVSPFAELAVLEQSKNEQILVDGLEGLGVEVMWNHALVGLEHAELHATATLAGPDGPVIVQARYVVGADGARSEVRELLGIPFEGVTNEHTFFLADALGATGLVEDFVNIRISPDDVLLTFPMGEPGHARIIGVVRDSDLDESGELPESLVRTRIARNFVVAYRESTWFATYRLHHRVAARFRDGCCFLVGDAAHIHSPVGGQGMNTGLQDAHDLACAIGDVVLRGMPDRRLDRYEIERRPVALRLVSTTDRLFAVMTSDSPRSRFLRGRVIPRVGPIALRVLPKIIGGRRMFGFLSQTRIRYRVSATPPSDVQRREDVVGKRLAWAGDNYDVLRSLTWQVHSYGAPVDLVSRVADRLGIEHHSFAPDPHRRLRTDRLYLVRPDGFVAAEARVAAGLAAQSGLGEGVVAVPASFREQLAG